jgi:hypothetical protein
MTSEMTLTYQTRLLLNERQNIIFDECAGLLSTIERALYAETAICFNSLEETRSCHP